jgi:hypothetical protein
MPRSDRSGTPLEPVVYTQLEPVAVVESPRELVEDAVVEGKLRERRIILQAKEAQTNRFLAYAAIFASIVALSVPFVERFL